MRLCIEPFSSILHQELDPRQGLKTSLIGGPIALYFDAHKPYIRLMNQTTQTMPTISMPIKVSYDMACEGVANVWEAHGLIAAEAELMDSDILSVKFRGLAANGWPELEVIFDSTSAARVYTAAYLGLDVTNWTIYHDDDVNEYLAFGEFC